MSTFTYQASGKLLLFGEYLVLRGSRCLAMPLSVGQTLAISHSAKKSILWRCFEFEKCWLEIYFSEKLEIIQTTDKEKAKIVQKLLLFIRTKNPKLNLNGLSFHFDLNFDRQFGLGTSATLISLLSQWSGVNPYLLLEQSFGGSGYDLAASIADQPFLYSIKERKTEHITLPETITQKLLFIYTGRKQKSAGEINRFKNQLTNDSQMEQMNTIVKKAVQCTQIEEWERIMRESEQLLSGILGQKPVQDVFFSNYPYQIKSLGAWGGDFIMATCRDISFARKYFDTRNKRPVYTYNELIK